MGQTKIFISAGMLFLAAQTLSAFFYEPKLPTFEHPVLESQAVLDECLVLLGLRRFGGDLAFIQMLQYIQTPIIETDEYRLEKMNHPLESDPVLRQNDKTFEYTLRCASLDPYFHSATLFGSALLAFHNAQPDQALQLLEQGLKQDPTYWQFRLYATAIGYHRAEKMEKAIRLLEEALLYPDCPTMVKNILAFTHRKQGNLKRALEIYIDIAETSREENYVKIAQKNIQELRGDLHLQ